MRTLVANHMRSPDGGGCPDRSATRHLTTIRYLFLLTVLLVAGCGTDKEFERRDALQRDPTWPTIRAVAEMEIAHREGTTAWSYQAYYHPREHTNGVWAVVAEGSYPLGAEGDYIDLVIRDGGEVVSASPRLPTCHPNWK